MSKIFFVAKKKIIKFKVNQYFIDFCMIIYVAKKTHNKQP